MAILIILSILAIGLILMATESLNRMNKAAVAMFVGVICWLIYIGYGTDFVVAEHQIDFLSYLSDNSVGSRSVKSFIASSIFIRYVVAGAEVVLFLLGTMTIVEVLNNNGCFDFIPEWLRTRRPLHYLWMVSGITFVISANMDNLTTACLMLGIMHSMISDSRQRLIFGSAIVISAACGGAFTVIGDVTSLALWTGGRVTPTTYSGMTILPCLAALLTILGLMSRSLPHRLALTRTVAPYRGDDTVLTRWQRLALLAVGIGGLWFIPTFHRITLLPPFVGCLCVLALLWIVNELCNRALLGSDRMVQKRQPEALQYVNIQHILLFIGLTLAFGAVNETGILTRFFDWCAVKLDSFFVIATSMGALSSVFGNVATVLANMSVCSPDVVEPHAELVPIYAPNGYFWPLISYSTAVGSLMLPAGTMAGFALMRMEGVKWRTYLSHISGKVLAGWVVGLLVYYIMVYFVH